MDGDQVIASVNPRELSAQQRAVEQQRALAKPFRFQIQANAEGFPMILGRYGQIELRRRELLLLCASRPVRSRRPPARSLTSNLKAWRA